jgi:DNA-binding PadR family transcriptional regulator
MALSSDYAAGMSIERLQEPSFLILTALAGGPRHGYALLEEIADLSGGAVRLRVGSLYGALDRLAGQGLIEVDREEVVDSRLRRYYRLSAAGAQRLAVEATRVHRQASAAIRRLKLGGAPA